MTSTDGPSSTQDPGPVRPDRRIAELDALRGFALCGIIFINVPQTMEMFDHAGQLPDVLRVFFLGRFYPIFFLLFGIGFGIFLRSARRRVAQPQTLLVRRFVALGGMGALLHVIQPGEVLLPLAITGVLVLLPYSFLRRGVLLHGVVLTAAGVLAGVGGFGLLPGLLVLGYALAESDVHKRLRKWRGRLVAVGAGAVVTGAAAVALIMLGTPGIAQIRLGLALSLSMAAVYLVLFLFLLRTPAGPAVSAALAPMGRMALTNYITAALLFVPIGAALGLRESSQWATAAVLGTSILVVQALFSGVWLRRFRYGPLEWIWRCVTYWRWLPIRGEAGTG